MTSNLHTGAAVKCLFFLAAIVAVAAFMLSWGISREVAAAKGAKGAGVLPNFDIRSDKGYGAYRAKQRQRNGAPDYTRSQRQKEAEEQVGRLRSQVPSLKLERHPFFETAEVISADVSHGQAFLTDRAIGKRSGLLKGFIAENRAVFGLTAKQVNDLMPNAEDAADPDRISVAILDQRLNGVPVFQGKVKAGFSPSGELVRVVNDLAPDLDESVVSADFGQAEVAEEAALRSVIGSGVGSTSATTSAEKTYFPLETGVAVPAWKVLVWTEASGFYVVVDAVNLEVLWRKNITDEQSQPATYGVYTNPGAMINVAHSPFPFWPAPTSPGGLQAPGISRVSITRVGNEPPYTFNNLGWLPDGVTKTDGNAVQAGLDRDGVDGIDPGSEAFSATRNFVFDYTPVNPNTNVGESPTPATQTYPGTAYQQGVITQLFYISNWFHDEMYLLGFDEAAGNFQKVNFTGQGRGGDPVWAEAQDSSSFNNASFSTTSDGESPRLQMHIFDGANPNVDGALDGDVVVHELMHGVTQRLHGDGLGIFNDMSRGIGEGYSDFFAMSLLSQPTDPLDGLYTTGAYASYRSVGVSNNAYYGLRRFPTAIISAVGANGKPHNPLTFADIDQTTSDVSDGAFAPRSMPNADEVHASGEVWASALWEVRARMITRLGWQEGNRRLMKMILDGMKIAPISPTFIDERNAIIAAAFAAGSPDDVADIWAGFALRGLGAQASVEDAGGLSVGGTGTTRVTQSFSLPNLTPEAELFFFDQNGDNDGFPEPGEPITIGIVLTNATGRTVTGISLEVVGGTTANFGTMSGSSSASKQVRITIPESAPCGASIPLTFNVNSSAGPISFTRNLFIGKPSGPVTTVQNFDTVTAPALPAGWTAESVQNGVNFVTSTVSPHTAPNAVFALDPKTVGGGTDLTSPAILVNSSISTVTFQHSYDTEKNWDGGVLEISIAGGAYRDILDTGAVFIEGGYNDILKGGTNNPVARRRGWTGSSKGYISTTVQLPSSAMGKVIHLRWRFGADNNTASQGWFIDSVSLSRAVFVSGFACSYVSQGKTAVSISGRVTTPTGAGLRGVTVTLFDEQGYERRVLTSSLGFYSIDQVPARNIYNIRATSKKYRFAPLSVAPNVDDVANVDFVGFE